jgi:hypothetical protein
MTIKVVGKQEVQKYQILCTDKCCRNILEFDYDDIGFNKTFSMGSEVDNINGIVCPDCNQVLNFKYATKI